MTLKQIEQHPAMLIEFDSVSVVHFADGNHHVPDSKIYFILEIDDQLNVRITFVVD